MRRKKASTRPSYYVRAVPYAGDLPYLEIRIGEGNDIYLTSNKQGRFDVYRCFVPDISRQQQEDDGIFRQPDWAFLISNGVDQLYLHTNAGEVNMTIRFASSDIDIRMRMADDQAKELCMSLIEECKKHKLSHIANEKLKPLGIWYTYKVKRMSLSFEPVEER